MWQVVGSVQPPSPRANAWKANHEPRRWKWEDWTVNVFKHFLYKHKSLYCVSEYVLTYRRLTVTQIVNQNISVRAICNFRSALNEVLFYYYACLIINSHRCTQVRICVYLQACRVFNFCETLVRRLVDKISQLNLVRTLLVVSSFWVLF